MECPGIRVTGGEYTGHVRCNLSVSKAKFQDLGDAEVRRYATDCPVSGCSRCDLTDCYYAVFIRHYWKFPVCD
jgi:hypothetical protein